MEMKQHSQILIVGGGTGGNMVAAQLQNRQSGLSMAIIEPSYTHYYQEAFTLVGAGTYAMHKTKRSEASLIPSGVDWIRDKAMDVYPDENKVATEKNGNIGYDYLVVAPGLVNDLSLIEGLEDALHKG